MNETDIMDFSRRRWEQHASLDRDYWAGEYRRKGHTVTLHASQLLFFHMKSVRPDWPDARQRQIDLDHHIRIKQLLDRIADGHPAG